MDECCDICGDIGVANAILTCRQCNINREHMYCTRVLLEKEPADGWICEVCEPLSNPMPQSPQVPINQLPVQSKLTKHVEFETGASSRGRNGPLNWEKRVKTGKTKYISADEAIMLSGSLGNHVPSPTRPKTGPNRFDKTPVKPKTAPIKSFYQNTPASGPSQHLKPKKVSFAELSEKPQQQSRKISELQRSASNVVSAQAHYVNMQKERPVQGKSPQTNAGILMKKRSPVAPPVIVSGGNGCTSVDRTSKNEYINANVLPDLEKSSYTPASDVVWKGCFNIQDSIQKGKLNQDILAYPPSRVLKKVYDFSKRMPQLLGFDMVPCDNIWPKLFPEYLPDKRDIALYLFPRHHQRSEDYILLLEKITAQNHALRVQIADVELLVFSSKLLPVNCQCWEGKNFLWGVFHRLKDATSLLKTRGPALPTRRSDDANYDHSQDDEDNDMDIDMIGGFNVGRTDVVKHMS